MEMVSGGGALGAPMAVQVVLCCRKYYSNSATGPIGLSTPLLWNFSGLLREEV